MAASEPPARRRRGAAMLPLLLLIGAAAVSAYDLQRVESRTLILYTTPALQEFLEKEALPAYTARTGQPVVAVYLNAGSEYHRVKLSSQRPEADLFLHASPLYMEKGRVDGLFDLTTLGNATYLHNPPAQAGGSTWHTFAWSPLVEVYGKDKPQPDIANADVRFGLAHPRLSNNGIYVALLYNEFGPELRDHAMDRTIVQPTNARATIGGVADGSYEVTIGYEAVAAYYTNLGAKVSYDVPLIDGKRVTAPVLFSVGLVHNHPHPGAEEFLHFLMEPAIQQTLAKYGMRSVIEGIPGPKGGIDLSNARMVDFDWPNNWTPLEKSLPLYEVNR